MKWIDIREERTSLEKMPPPDWPVRIYLISDWCRRTQSQYHPWAIGSGLYRKQAEQAVGSKPVGRVCTWPLLQFLLLGSFPVWVPAWASLSDGLWLRYVRQMKSFPPQAAFGHGVSHSNRSKPGHVPNLNKAVVTWLFTKGKSKVSAEVRWPLPVGLRTTYNWMCVILLPWSPCFAAEVDQRWRWKTSSLAFHRCYNLNIKCPLETHVLGASLPVDVLFGSD